VEDCILMAFPKVNYERFHWHLRVGCRPLPLNDTRSVHLSGHYTRLPTVFVSAHTIGLHLAASSRPTSFTDQGLEHTDAEDQQQR